MYADITMYRGMERIIASKFPHRKYVMVGYSHAIDHNNIYMELNAFNISMLKDAEVEFGGHLQKVYRHMFSTVVKLMPEIVSNEVLREFQKKGILFLHAKKGRGLLADEQGLGKTAQIIGLMATVPERYIPAIVLSPAHLKENWYDELGKFWTNERVFIAYGQEPQPIPPKTKVVIINQQILKYWEEELIAFGAKWLVIDEAQNFVSTRTATYEVVSRVADTIRRTCLITGTPLVNNVQDLWGLIKLVNPYILGGWTHFIHRFDPAGAFDHRKVQMYQRKNTWGRRVGARDDYEAPEPDRGALKLLNNILARTVMIRRLKKDVWEEMPKKCRQIIRIKVTDKEFWKAELELRGQIKEALKIKDKRGDAVIDMRSYSRMRQIVGNAKFDHICGYIDEFLSDNTGKLVVTGWHKDILKRLHEKYPDSYLVTGDIDSKKKHAIGKEFQSAGGKRILFGNIKSIGTGITLTASDTMLFVEFPFTGADLAQVEDRIHRLSQMAKKVWYLYFVVKDSLEEKLLKYISRKQKLSGRVIDNTEVKTLEEISDDTPDTAVLKNLLLD